MPEPRRPAPLRGAAAREKRSNLFALTLAAAVLLAVGGLLLDSARWDGIVPTVSVFGLTFTPHPTFVCWVVSIYSFVLATRAVWLPDEKLRSAVRNLWALVISVGVVCVLTLILWKLMGKLPSGA
jgi:hypothetical protein